MVLGFRPTWPVPLYHTRCVSAFQTRAEAISPKPYSHSRRRTRRRGNSIGSRIRFSINMCFGCRSRSWSGSREQGVLVELSVVLAVVVVEDLRSSSSSSKQ